MCQLTPVGWWLDRDVFAGSADLYETAFPRPSEMTSSTTKATLGLTPTLRYFADVSIMIPAMSIVPSVEL